MSRARRWREAAFERELKDLAVACVRREQSSKLRAGLRRELVQRVGMEDDECCPMGRPAKNGGKRRKRVTRDQSRRRTSRDRDCALESRGAVKLVGPDEAAQPERGVWIANVDWVE